LCGIVVLVPFGIMLHIPDLAMVIRRGPVSS
jgi:hypothetical protein